ncbi:hypothetical protein AVEN_271057-1 [Araneus ventricosus]|uniref:Uncharacterized protein n=1 Tax=Araneus ventricosus TaxID=182803 RepID=A0A4Y2FE53_ARAVE|nr:hypothetical protein AVEN_271057-1 [Araneus ventricosus]
MLPLKLQHPFGVILAVPSGVGRTYFLKLLLNTRAQMIEPAIEKVIWFYGKYQPLYDEIHDVTFAEGFPCDYKGYAGCRTLFAIDDLIAECGIQIGDILFYFSRVVI